MTVNGFYRIMYIALFVAMYILYDIFTLGVAQFLQFHFVVATTSQLCGNFTLEFDITSTKCAVGII